MLTGLVAGVTSSQDVSVFSFRQRYCVFVVSLPAALNGCLPGSIFVSGSFSKSVTFSTFLASSAGCGVGDSAGRKIKLN